MPTFSVTVKKSENLQEYKDRFTKWQDHLPGKPNKEEALIALLDLCEEGIESLKARTEPASVQQTLEAIGCPFLKYIKFNFQCFERSDAQKKPDHLGIDPRPLYLRIQ